MELTKITSRGQITLPITIRHELNLKDGDKVAFVKINGEYKILNPTKMVISEAQKAFDGLADELGLKTEEDAIALCSKVRKEMWETNNAGNDWY